MKKTFGFILILLAGWLAVFTTIFLLYSIPTTLSSPSPFAHNAGQLTFIAVFGAAVYGLAWFLLKTGRKLRHNVLPQKSA